MEGLYFTSSSQDQSYDYSTTPPYYDYSAISYDDRDYKPDIIYVVTCIIIAVGLPLTLVAIYSLCSMVRRDHVAPIYVINLLITDLLQFCCMILHVARPENVKVSLIFSVIYDSALLASIYFMVCVALERYLVIAHPLWYRFRRTIKTSVVVCVLVWVFSLVFVSLLFFFHGVVTLIILAVLLLLPFPLLIFFLVGTLKALSAAISVPSDEKRRILGILVLLLLIYTLPFLPIILHSVNLKHHVTLTILFVIFVRLNPLADLLLYVFMRKGFIDKLLTSVCCCRMDSSPSVFIPLDDEPEQSQIII